MDSQSSNTNSNSIVRTSVFQKDETDGTNAIMSSEDEQKYSLNVNGSITTNNHHRVKNTDATAPDEIGPPLPPRPPPRQRFVPSADTGNLCFIACTLVFYAIRYSSECFNRQISSQITSQYRASQR